MKNGFVFHICNLKNIAAHLTIEKKPLRKFRRSWIAKHVLVSSSESNVLDDEYITRQCPGTILDSDESGSEKTRRSRLFLCDPVSIVEPLSDGLSSMQTYLLPFQVPRPIRTPERHDTGNNDWVDNHVLVIEIRALYDVDSESEKYGLPPPFLAPHSLLING